MNDHEKYIVIEEFGYDIDKASTVAKVIASGEELTAAIGDTHRKGNSIFTFYKRTDWKVAEKPTA